MIWLYRIGFAIDILTLIFIFYQYFILPLFKSYSTTKWNGTLTISTLILTGVISVAYYLGNNDSNYSLATILLWIPAVPVVLYMLLLLALIVSKPDWK